MTIESDRFAELRKAKLRALVDGLVDASSVTSEVRSIPAGATLSGTGLAPSRSGTSDGAEDQDPAAITTWMLVEGAAAVSCLGAGLAVATRAGATSLQVIVDDGRAAAIIARRAIGIGFDIGAWTIAGTTASPVDAAPPEVEANLDESVLARGMLLADAGLRPVIEGGNLIGELAGLEVARVVTDDAGNATVEAGVGRFDREAGAMMRAEMDEAGSLDTVIGIVGPLRRPGAERHPMNQLVRERWLRDALLRDPTPVGAVELVPVGSAIARDDLYSPGVASATGTADDGRPVIVTCTLGEHLDAIPAAVDDRICRAPDARLVLAVPAGGVPKILHDLLGYLDDAELIEVDPPWDDQGPAAPHGEVEA